MPVIAATLIAPFGPTLTGAVAPSAVSPRNDPRLYPTRYCPSPSEPPVAGVTAGFERYLRPNAKVPFRPSEVTLPAAATALVGS